MVSAPDLPQDIPKPFMGASALPNIARLQQMQKEPPYRDGTLSSLVDGALRQHEFLGMDLGQGDATVVFWSAVSSPSVWETMYERWVIEYDTP